MHRLQYRIDAAVFAAHPAYRRGVVVVRDADNMHSGAALEPLLRTAEARSRERLLGAAVTD